MQKRRFRAPRLSEFAVDEIQRIISEEYRVPGSRIPTEEHLADRLKVSRIVIREAMKILEDRGVVAIRAGRGTVTVAPSPDRVKESLLRLFRKQPVPTLEDMQLLLELRQVLEETAAGLAAVRRSADDLAEIEMALKEMRMEDGDVDCTIAADLCFHRSVMRAAHNPFIEMVLDPLMEVFLQQIRLTNSFNVGWKLHQNILLEIQAHNPVGARQAVRRLMKVTMADSHTALNNL